MYRDSPCQKRRSASPARNVLIRKSSFSRYYLDNNMFIANAMNSKYQCIIFKFFYCFSKISWPRSWSYMQNDGPYLWTTIFFFCCGAASQRGSWPPHSWGFLNHTQRRTTVGRTPLDKWSACRRDLYLTKHNTHNRQTSMPPMGFESTISAGERRQAYALDRAATGTGMNYYLQLLIFIFTAWQPLVGQDLPLPRLHHHT